MGNKDPRIDDYIAEAAPFARPILAQIRAAVHAGCPGVEETIKWRAPHFMYKGMLCGMAAFKEHCAFGFWKASLLAPAGSASPKEAMGQYGRITSVKDLPARRTLVALVRQAAKLNDEGVKVPRRTAARQPRAQGPLAVPAALMDALRRNKRALGNFENFSPSHRREYIEWIAEAKGEATRDRRIATAIAWLAEGKSRNWKYEPTR
jgi:hypothetical protein